MDVEDGREAVRQGGKLFWHLRLMAWKTYSCNTWKINPVFILTAVIPVRA